VFLQKNADANDFTRSEKSAKKRRGIRFLRLKIGIVNILSCPAQISLHLLFMTTKTGSVILIDDDVDDREMFALVIKGLKIQNEVMSFAECHTALEYLESQALNERPFIILCDINLPIMNGVAFKKKIDENEILRKKNIPFIFLSTAFSKTLLEQVHNYNVQGYFLKGLTLDELRKSIALILEYWSLSKHPDDD